MGQRDRTQPVKAINSCISTPIIAVGARKTFETSIWRIDAKASFQGSVEELGYPRAITPSLVAEGCSLMRASSRAADSSSCKFLVALSRV